ncbi:MAG: hypothetical protein HYZ11_08705 [Candidatus Tectomicrobia bacterium]|uniref:Uncharacterized protein n=1 Tax=Tectimicrobiota bacterium TaxID=2528274 RepID=A0A932I0S3_UNCTE|nr:hypothetical protein [Candidatus Tectomicrobia bacterium]
MAGGGHPGGHPHGAAPGAASEGGGLLEHEKRFLARIAQKYEKDEKAGQARSYLIAAAVILAFFALIKFLPWWWASLAIALAGGLYMFHQYKRFTRFKTRILLKLWREREKGAPTGAAPPA